MMTEAISGAERLKSVANEHASASAEFNAVFEELISLTVNIGESVDQYSAFPAWLEAWQLKMAGHIKNYANALTKLTNEIRATLPALRGLVEVVQTSERFEDFTKAERNIRGLLTVEAAGTEVPWLTPFGVGLVKIYGIRRRDGLVEFGIGNQNPTILGWVTAERFHYEWPN